MTCPVPDNWIALPGIAKNAALKGTVNKGLHQCCVAFQQFPQSSKSIALYKEKLL